MKVIMYHYVRPDSRGFPYFRYLSFENFRKQLDFFEEVGHLITREEFFEALEKKTSIPDGFLLTFDDGFKDHVKYVVPELLRRRAVGLFFVPTHHYSTKKLLHVHRIHHLLGKYGGETMLQELEKISKGLELPFESISAFQTDTYKRQNNDLATTKFKRVMNYFTDSKSQDIVLDKLMYSFFDEKELHGDLYLTEKEIVDINNSGMIVGSHTQQHRVLSKLSEDEQFSEIKDSFAFIENLIGSYQLKTFCYPYGGEHSFNVKTEQILKDIGCEFAFNVEPRELLPNDITNRPTALPRFDCNQFSFGQANLG